MNLLRKIKTGIATRVFLFSLLPFAFCGGHCKSIDQNPQIGSLPETKTESRSVTLRPAHHVPLPREYPLPPELLREIDLVVVPSSPPQYVALGTALIARLAQEHSQAHLLVIDPNWPLSPGVEHFISQYAPKQALFIEADGKSRSGEALNRCVSYVIEGNGDVANLSLELSRRFWKPGQSVTFSGLQGRSLIPAASWASHRALPLVLLPEGHERSMFRRARRQLSPQETFYVCSGEEENASLRLGNPPPVKLSPTTIAERLARDPAWGEATGTVVVARCPEPDEQLGTSAWLAPYAGFVRRAPVVMIDSGKAEHAEAAVAALAKTQGWSPQNIMLLADEDSIGLHLLEIGIPSNRQSENEEQNNEEASETNQNSEQILVDVEPFTLPEGEWALTTAVGRIPCNRLDDASLLLARTFSRNRLLANISAKVLLVANPNHESGDLPFCETVSRATGSELRNLSIPLSEFNQQCTDSREVLNELTNSVLVIYQGHLYDQLMLEDQEEFHNDQMPDSGNLAGDELDVEFDMPKVITEYFQLAAEMHFPGLVPHRDNREEIEPLEEVDDEEENLPENHVPKTMRPPFQASPIWILQSCTSLDQETFQNILNLGGIALVGSTTNIHSASGSTFVKAMIDRGLYQNATVGEALRDARNYYLCLHDLKKARNHSQLAQGLRVALSFRLWGDPQARLFPHTLPTPALPRVEARWNAGDELQLTFPKKRLPEARSSRYSLKLFPGSEAAGIVRRVKNDDRRRIMPIHFLRLKPPPEAANNRYTGVVLSSGEENRAVFRYDPSGRYLYILYFPRREHAGDQVTLRFVRPGSPANEKQ